MRSTMSIKNLLEAAHREFHHPKERTRDPVQFAHRYQAPRDQEVAALFSALLAYGNVQTILKSVERVLAPLGNSPHQTLLKGNFAGVWNTFRHRFTTGEDIEILAWWLKNALHTHGSLERFFTHGADLQDTSMKVLLSSFVLRFTSQPLPEHLQKVSQRRERNLKYLLSDPQRGSACKRINMFLRWMVRPEDGVDLGIWRSLSPSLLMLPIDTHLLQTLHKLKWTKSATANWKAVEEATARLKRIRPEDPIRYDFALCHLSMHGKDIRKHYRSLS